MGLIQSLLCVGFRSTDNSSKDGESMAVPEEQSSVADGAETVSDKADSGATWNWKEENRDAPKSEFG